MFVHRPRLHISTKGKLVARISVSLPKRGSKNVNCDEAELQFGGMGKALEFAGFSGVADVYGRALLPYAFCCKES